MDSYFEIHSNIKEESRRYRVLKFSKETLHAIIIPMKMCFKNLCRLINIGILTNQFRNENMMRVKRIDLSKEF